MNRTTAIFEGVRGVVFDMDGTIVTSALDFRAIRAEAGVPDGTPVLEYIDRADAATQERVRGVLHAHERRAALACELLPGARETLDGLRQRGLALALLTRNSAESARMVVERFGLEFDCRLAREDAPPKPSPEPVRAIATRLGLPAADLLVVGDYVFDIQSGQAAGARTALLRTPKPLVVDPPPDVVIDGLCELLTHFDVPSSSNEVPA